MASQSHRIPSVTRLNRGKPIIEKADTHPWENKVTFNPGCVLLTDAAEVQDIVSRLPLGENRKKIWYALPALCFLLYRAQGERTEEYDYTKSSIGLAICSPELQVLARLTEPVLRPEETYENLGVEDPRITKIGDRYFMFYTAYSSAEPANLMRIAVASTKDFVTWEKHGLLKGSLNLINNKNAMLFPDQPNGKYLMLHRPMEGQDPMAIHWAESDDILGEWKTMGLLMKPIPRPSNVDTWIGGGAPPLRLADGRYLILYHIGNLKPDSSREYNLGIALGDLKHPQFIVKRDEPLLRPETRAETAGDADLGVDNVVFICGAYFYNGDLYFPYAGADSVVLGGKIPKAELERYITS